jgi:membrane glycosyltransferase
VFALGLPALGSNLTPPAPAPPAQVAFTFDTVRERAQLLAAKDYVAEPNKLPGYRGDAGTTFREAWRRHWPSMFLGLSWAGLLWVAAPKLFWWFSPVFTGLALVVPVSVWSSRVTVGEWAQTYGLFLTPAEVNPPEILRRLEQNLLAARARPWAANRDGLVWVIEEPKVCETHLRLLSSPPEPLGPLQEHYLEGLRLKARHVGPESLTSKEKRALLLDADSVRALCAEPIPLARAAG